MSADMASLRSMTLPSRPIAMRGSGLTSIGLRADAAPRPDAVTSRAASPAWSNSALITEFLASYGTPGCQISVHEWFITASIVHYSAVHRSARRETARPRASATMRRRAGMKAPPARAPPPRIRAKSRCTGLALVSLLNRVHQQLDDDRRHAASSQANDAAPQFRPQFQHRDTQVEVRDTRLGVLGDFNRLLTGGIVELVDFGAEVADRRLQCRELRNDEATGFEPT